MSGVIADLPTINPSFHSRPNRYAYVATLDVTVGMPTFDGVVKFDLSSPPGTDAASNVLKFGPGCKAGEVTFVPRFEQPELCDGAPETLDGLVAVCLATPASPVSCRNVCSLSRRNAEFVMLIQDSIQQSCIAPRRRGRWLSAGFRPRRDQQRLQPDRLRREDDGARAGGARGAAAPRALRIPRPLAHAGAAEGALGKAWRARACHGSCVTVFRLFMLHDVVTTFPTAAFALAHANAAERALGSARRAGAPAMAAV